MSETSEPLLQAVGPNEATPASVDPTEVLAALNADHAPVRQRGARVCQKLAADDVDAVRPFVDALRRALRDDNPGVVQTAAGALTEVATTDPDAVTDVLTEVATLADSDLGGVQMAGAQLLAAVAQQQPSHCTTVIQPLLSRLTQPLGQESAQSVATCVDDRVTQRTIQQHEHEERRHKQVARQLVANIVVAAAEAEPSAVIPHVETVADLTTAEDLVIRGAALDILAVVGRESSEAVAPVADAVRACLDANKSVVRARAVQTLGYLDEARHVDVLSDVAETDPDDDVAAFAAETAAFLDA